jgi:transposase
LKIIRYREHTGGDKEKKGMKMNKHGMNKSELVRLLEEHPDWYLREFAEKFGVCSQAIHKMFEKIGITRKKNFYLFGKAGGGTGSVSE